MVAGFSSAPFFLFRDQSIISASELTLLSSHSVGFSRGRGQLIDIHLSEFPQFIHVPLSQELWHVSKAKHRCFSGISVFS